MGQLWDTQTTEGPKWLHLNTAQATGALRIRKTGFPAQAETFKTKSQAQRWARKIETDMDEGRFVSLKEASETTLGELLKRYMLEITPAKKGAEPEATRLKLMIRHPVCKISLAYLKPSDIARYRDDRLTHVSGGTVLKELSLFKCAIDTGIRDWGIYLPANPVPLVRRPKTPRARDRRLTSKELTRMETSLQDCRNDWIQPIVYFAIETAMRRSEILNLRWDNVSLKQRTAHLPTTKNGEPRTVPLSSKGSGNSEKPAKSN